MKVLSIETATAVCAAAIVENATVVVEESREEERAHSERLVGIIEKILHGTDTPLGAIDAIAVSIGPGSFTGLRIGLSVAKGLAFSAGKPITAVSTLEALARNCIVRRILRGDELIVPLIDARRDEFFVAAYRREKSSLTCMLSARSANVGDLYDLLAAEQKIIIVGNGTEKFRQYLMKMDNSERFILPPREHTVCSAASVGLIGEEQAARMEFSDVASLEPLYIKGFFTKMKPLSTTK